MKIAVLAITRGGRQLAQTIASRLEGCQLLGDEESVSSKLKKNWLLFDGFICIMATGIVVRSIASLLRDKKTDPCILALDERGSHVISLLSGHLGGGNALAAKVAHITGGKAVITTSSDTQELVPLDLWAQAQGLTVSHSKVLTRASSLLVNRGKLLVFSDFPVNDLPKGLEQTEDIHLADIIISYRRGSDDKLYFHPQNLVIGVGCNRGTAAHEFTQVVTELFSDLRFSLSSIKNLASIDAKNDEEGLLLFGKKHGWPIHFFSREQINQVKDVTVSEAALRAVGAIGVAEPTALLSAETTKLLSRKRKWQNITMAVAAADYTLSAQVLDPLIT